MPLSLDPEIAAALQKTMGGEMTTPAYMKSDSES